MQHVMLIIHEDHSVSHAKPSLAFDILPQTTFDCCAFISTLECRTSQIVVSNLAAVYGFVRKAARGALALRSIISLFELSPLVPIILTAGFILVRTRIVA